MKRLLALLLLIPCLSFADETKPEDNPHVSGEPGAFVLGVRNDAGTALTGTDGDYSPFAVDSRGRLFIGGADTNAGGLAKAEDSGHANTDAGIMCLGVRNDSGTTYAGTNADYSPMSVNRQGAQLTDINSLYVQTGDLASSILKKEDDGSAHTDTGVTIMSVRTDTLSTSTSLDADYQALKSDNDGRVYVNAYGAEPSEFWSACSGQETGTADRAIKAAVASNRIYVTSIACYNDDAAVGSIITFKDGAATTLYANYIGFLSATAVSQFDANLILTFPTPLRGSVNTAFNFAMTTTSTQTVCCASGFISTN